MDSPTRTVIAPQPQSLERAARVRAARAYAGLNQQDIGDALGISVVTVKRMERGHREISVSELQQVARLCAVPMRFMLNGFDAGPMTDDDDTQVILSAIEDVRAQINDLRAVANDTTSLLSGGGLPRP